MNEVRYRRQLAIHFSEKETSILRLRERTSALGPRPHVPCPMPDALGPMPMSTSRNLRKAILITNYYQCHAPCPMPDAQCPIPDFFKKSGIWVFGKFLIFIQVTN
ncbi:MAG: hypothetical protein WBL95_07120 [Microcoleus sp.]